MRDYVILTLFLLVIIAAAFRIGYNVGLSKDGAVAMSDTLVIRDTLTIVRPEVRDVERVRVDTVRLAVMDTLLIRDSATVEIPIERKTYEGSDYLAVVTGYRPSLESISVFPEIRNVTVTIREPSKPRKVSLGIAAGPSMLYDGRLRAGVGLTGGLVVNF